MQKSFYYRLLGSEHIWKSLGKASWRRIGAGGVFLVIVLFWSGFVH